MDFKTSSCLSSNLLESSSFRRNSKSGSYVSSINVSLHIFERSLYQVRNSYSIRKIDSIYLKYDSLIITFSKVLFARIIIYIIFYNTFCIVSFYEVFFEIRIFRILIRLTSEYFSPHGFPSLRALTSKMITFQSDHKYNLMIFFLLKVNIQDILYRCYVPGLSCRKLDSYY